MSRIESLQYWILRLLSSRKMYVERKPSDTAYTQKILLNAIGSMTEFFTRLGGEPDFKGKTVLDVGCGIGAFVLHAAERGAEKAVGEDIDQKALDFCMHYAEARNLQNLYFTNQLPEEQFDIVFSKDCMEHYARPEEFIFSLKNRLKPGGRLYIGFSPLWKSPFGGHTGPMTKLPWAHLIFPEKVIMRELSRFNGHEIKSWEEYGLNRMTIQRYLKICKDAGLEFEFLKVNTASGNLRLVFALFRALGKIKPLGEYVTFNVYSVLHNVH